jgi:hypothetical protein
MKTLETYFTVSKGKLKYTELDKFKHNIANLPDGYYSNTIKRVYNNRSNEQNKYYWGVVLPNLVEGLKDVGYAELSIEEAHEFCKNKFIFQETKNMCVVNKVTGEIQNIKYYPSTAKLTTTEFNEYFERIIIFASEYLSINIPYPNE